MAQFKNHKNAKDITIKWINIKFGVNVLTDTIWNRNE